MQFSTGVETYPSTLVEDMAYDIFIAAICLGLLPKLPYAMFCPCPQLPCQQHPNPPTVKLLWV